MNIVIFLDEAGALFEGRNSKKFNSLYTQYLNQVRKLGIDLYLTTPDAGQIDKNFRRHIDLYYYIKPLLPFPFIEDIKIVRKRQKDDE